MVYRLGIYNEPGLVLHGVLIRLMRLDCFREVCDLKLNTERAGVALSDL